MFSLTRSARTKPGALRDHDAASPVPRTPDGTRLRQLIRLQRDPATPPRRISVEQSGRMLRGTGWQCGTRSARTVLEAFSIRGNSDASDASDASSGSGAAKWLISRRPSVLRVSLVLPVRFATAADVAVRQSDSPKYRRTGCTPIQGNGEFKRRWFHHGRWQLQQSRSREFQLVYLASAAQLPEACIHRTMEKRREGRRKYQTHRQLHTLP